MDGRFAVVPGGGGADENGPIILVGAGSVRRPAEGRCRCRRQREADVDTGRGEVPN